jgi:solute carrier family 13 (sodium-dependent dicarboxylate transporter), member 2/3/5
MRVKHGSLLPAEPGGPEIGTSGDTRIGARRLMGLVSGPLVLAFMLIQPAPASMGTEAWRTAAAGCFMAIWWMTEAVPIPVTALAPLVLFPLLGVMSPAAAAAPYANPVIFLFLGGFVLALAMQRHGLHRRVALGVVRTLGVRRDRVVLGFMAVTAFVSMWVSNTATAVMMLPIGVSILQLRGDGAGEAGPHPAGGNFGVALVLGIAYGASIGGLATLIGTPPNALLAGFMLETYGVEVGFAQWMAAALPLVLVALPLAWLVLTRVAFPVGAGSIAGGSDLLRDEYRRLGPASAGERRIAAIFVITAALWIVRPLLGGALPGLTDAGIAIAAAVATFIVPVDLRRGEFLMDWQTAERLPWGVLLLFGGGLSLADAVSGSGLAAWIGAVLSGLQAWPLVVVIALVTTVIIFLTELTSNTATAATFLPLIASLSIGLGENPFLLVVPAAIAASCAFMLPVATPPNAVLYASGYVTVPQMARAGVLLNVMFILLITALVYATVAGAFGAEIGRLPEWVGGGPARGLP